MTVSQLHFHSIAKVTKNKPTNERTIWAIPTEERMAAMEEVAVAINPLDVTFQMKGGEDSVRANSTNSIMAKWINFNSNRITPPDVRRNDKVMIYRIGSTEKYFWMDYNESNVKRLETVIYAFSADPGNPIKDDLSNAYYFAISTHDKTVTLQTCKANEEPFAYSVQLNTEVGNFAVQDDVGNIIWLDSENTNVGASNADGTWIALDGKDIKMNAPNDVEVFATNNIHFTCDTFKIDAKTSITYNTNALSIAASNSIDMKTSAFKSTADSNVFECPTSTFSGMIKCAGLAVGGARSSKGERSADAVVNGSMSVTGKLEASEIVCTKFNASQGHIGSFTHGGGKCC